MSDLIMNDDVLISCLNELDWVAKSAITKINTLEAELDALRNPWRDAENDPPIINTDVICQGSDVFIGWIFNGLWYESGQDNNSDRPVALWMPIPAPNEVDAVSNPVNPNEVKS